MTSRGRHLGRTFVPFAAFGTSVLESFQRASTSSRGAGAWIPAAPAAFSPGQARWRLHRGLQAGGVGTITPGSFPLCGHARDEEIAIVAHKGQRVTDHVGVVIKGIPWLWGINDSSIIIIAVVCYDKAFNAREILGTVFAGDLCHVFFAACCGALTLAGGAASVGPLFVSESVM